MSYLEQSLGSGEQVVLQTKIALRKYWANFLMGIFLLLIYTALASENAEHSGYALWSGLAILAGPLLVYFTNELGLTNRRIVARRGIFIRKTIEISLPKIESVQVHQGIFGRLLNYGTLVVAGTGGSKERIPDIPRPLKFRAAIADAMEHAGPLR